MKGENLSMNQSSEETAKTEVEADKNHSPPDSPMSESSESPESLEASLEESSQNEEIQTQEEEKEDYKTKYYYLAAEMENLRKRHHREREDFLKYGNEKILNGLIEVVDNLDRTLDSLSEEDKKDEKVKNISVGVEMIQKQFLDVLKQSGLKMVETEGQIFDPHVHEALGQQKAEGKEDQEILSVYQKGYILNGRLLRAAKVIVAKND